MMNNKTKSLILIPILLVALALTLTIAKQRQETRRGAADEVDLTMLLNPASVEVKKGDKFDVDLMVNTKKTFAGAGLIVCYTPNLSITAESDVVVWGDSLYSFLFNSDFDMDGVNKCSEFALINSRAYEAEKFFPVNELKSLFKIKFVANEAGEGSIYLLTDISNKNSDRFEFAGVVEGSINFGRDVEKVSVKVSETSAEPSPEPTATSTPTPEVTVTPIPSDKARVSVDFTFMGIATTLTPKCMSSPKVNVLIMSGDEKEEKDVVAKHVAGTTKYNLVFDLDSKFVGKDNVSIFLKGPQHLRVKYGVGGQKAVYNELHGKLLITGGEENKFDFSSYPILAGDVAEGKQDGSINPLDFAYIKKAGSDRTRVEDGKFLWGDLNGDCMVNAGDVGIFLNSLIEKQDQSY
jgi:hypothetical protein